MKQRAGHSSNKITRPNSDNRSRWSGEFTNWSTKELPCVTCSIQLHTFYLFAQQSHPQFAGKFSSSLPPREFLLSTFYLVTRILRLIQFLYSLQQRTYSTNAYIVIPPVRLTYFLSPSARRCICKCIELLHFKTQFS